MARKAQLSPSRAGPGGRSLRAAGPDAGRRPRPAQQQQRSRGRRTPFPVVQRGRAGAGAAVAAAGAGGQGHEAAGRGAAQSAVSVRHRSEGRALGQAGATGGWGSTGRGGRGAGRWARPVPSPEAVTGPRLATPRTVSRAPGHSRVARRSAVHLRNLTGEVCIGLFR